MIVASVSLALGGCHGVNVHSDPGMVSRELSWRTGVTPQRTAPRRQVIPSGVILDDGLSEDEALKTALTNNSAFQATIAQLGMAGGDAVQAGLIANPQLLVYFPNNLKEGQYTLFAPIESFLLRPARVKVANREYRRVGEQLVQNGLDLARDVRLAHTDLALAHEQNRLAEEAYEIRSNIAELTRRRLEDGEIGELEMIAARVDQLGAQAAQGVQEQSVAIAQARLATLIGLPEIDAPLAAVHTEPCIPPSLDESELIAQALACRPDYHAARWSVAAASQRSHLSRWLFLRLDGVIDIRSLRGFSLDGPGLRMDVPIFNRNQGGILRADWELNAAMHARDAIHDQIVQDVRTAARQFRQADDNLTILENDVAPALADALSIAQKGFADGGTDYLLVLQTTSQYLDARARILEQAAACRRVLAELERSVGSSLTEGGVDVERLLLETSPTEEPADHEIAEHEADPQVDPELATLTP